MPHISSIKSSFNKDGFILYIKFKYINNIYFYFFVNISEILLAKFKQEISGVAP